MPFQDERQVVMKRNTADAYRNTFAHAAFLLEPEEHIEGVANGSFGPGAVLKKDSAAAPQAASKGWSQDSELVITNSRLLIVVPKAGDHSVSKQEPLDLFAEATRNPSIRIFLPTTAREREEPENYYRGLQLDGAGVFYIEYGYWFHQTHDEMFKKAFETGA